MKEGTRVIKIKEGTHLKLKELQLILLNQKIELSFDQIITEMIDSEMVKSKKYN